MIQLTPHMRIWVAVEPVDFRQGVDGLCRVCRQKLSSDPMSGAVFVFRNRRAKALKILVYDGQGFWLCQKRLSAGRFRFWPSAPGNNPRDRFKRMSFRCCLPAAIRRRRRPYSALAFNLFFKYLFPVLEQYAIFKHRGRTLSTQDVTFIRD